MSCNRDVTVDLTFFCDGVHCGVLQTAEGQYDVYGETIKELEDNARELADLLGLTINVFNTESYPE